MIGDGSKCLTVPCTLPSFQWSPQNLVSSAGKGVVYMLAEKETTEPNVIDSESDSNEGSSILGGRHAYLYIHYFIYQIRMHD